MERIWLNNYDQGMPHTLQPYPQRTLLDEVTGAACQWPHRRALIFKGQRFRTANWSS